LSGTVLRTATVAPGNDGKGTAVVGALESCDLAARLLGAAVVQNADLSGDGASVPFSIAMLPRGEVHLAAFLDDDGNLDLKAPRPGPGDLVYGTGAGDGVLDCIAVDLTDGDRHDLAVGLNLVEEPLEP
jgi:hypothetical protein